MDCILEKSTNVTLPFLRLTCLLPKAGNRISDCRLRFSETLSGAGDTSQ